jgi:SET domain-containing protein
MIALTIKNAGDKGVGVFARKDFVKGEPIYHEMNNKSISMISLTNHSCNPNCNISLLMVTAKRDIKKGEEITINYYSVGFFQQPMHFACKCRSEGCMGHITIHGKEEQ